MPRTATSAKARRRKIPTMRPSVAHGAAYEALDFNEIYPLSLKFADYIESHFDEIADILLEYESYEVVCDETSRTLDILRNLNENKSFFALRIGAVTSFLPRNQPLYALTCFVIVPSLMAQEVHFRIPHSMRHFFPRLLRALKFEEFFPNVHISTKERLKFLKERSALRLNPKTEESQPVSEAVIFTGTSQHAEALRLVFDQRTLFIANGSGHNPVIVSEDADIHQAVEAVLTLSLYNQGQDCAGPNSILVHKHSMEPFMRVLHEELSKIRVGQYHDRSCRVGPISEPEDLVRIQALLIENRDWLDPLTPGVIRSSEVIVEPTIVLKPLKEGGNFTEVFAPVIFVQEYEKDADLSLYFENTSYPRNAMYVTIYGKSEYAKGLTRKSIDGKILHDATTLLFDRHLHMPGIERGTQPYGGFGYAASNFSIRGKLFCKPTLPQREIFDCLVKDLLRNDRLGEHKKALRNMTKIITKDVSKILGLKKAEVKNEQSSSFIGTSYVDALDIVASDSQRYIEFTPDRIFTLLERPNVEYMATIEPKRARQIRSLRKVLQSHKPLRLDEFERILYAVPTRPGTQAREKRAEQLAFFKDIYQLLLGKESGPRLVQFLLDADRQSVLDLLDV